MRSRSHISGAVHGGLVGLGIGALTGAGVLGVMYVAAHSTNKSSTDDELPFVFRVFTVMGALAGTAIGATIGGIAGR